MRWYHRLALIISLDSAFYVVMGIIVSGINREFNTSVTLNPIGSYVYWIWLIASVLFVILPNKFGRKGK